MTEDDRRWFIDAWAVLDGYAFASLRTKGSINASVTFFVAPPYFEPEPVASLATALGATRGHFQEGFRDSLGEEVPFESLAQVVEVVRRAYRAGGLDLNGAPVPTVPKPRASEGPAAVHPASLVNDQMKGTWRVLRAIVAGPTSPTSLEQLRLLLAALIEQSLPALVPKFLGYSVVTMLADLPDREGDRSVKAREMAAWIDRARGLGIQVSIDHAARSVTVWRTGEAQGFAWDVPELEQLPESIMEFMHPLMYRTGGALINDLTIPFVVPIPQIFQEETSQKYAAIPTLGHLMAAGTADRRYVTAVQPMHEIVPLLVVALFQVPTVNLPFPAFPPAPGSIESKDLSERAAAWLTSALPSDILAGHLAEETLHTLVGRLLGRSTDEEKPRWAVAQA